MSFLDSASKRTLPPIQNAQLKLTALTHRSYSHEHPGHPHYERLEFLGDAVLGFIVGQLLYHRYPDFSEAELTRRRSQLVDQTRLASLAKEMDIGGKMRIGKGMEHNGGRENVSLLSDILEALIGASLLDSGIETLTEFVESLFNPLLDAEDQQQLATSAKSPRPTPTIDPKSRLQQWALAKTHQLPEYVLLTESGLAHAKEFVFVVKIAGKSYGQGQGNSKQAATKQAAIATLESLGIG
ncbi:MAG: Ribonuclease [Cyanobacteriota bacterium]